jgi:hypothetical protein
VGDGENLGFHIFDLAYTCVEKYVTGLNHKGDTYCVTDLTVKLIVCDKNQSIFITLMIQLYLSIS